MAILVTGGAGFVGSHLVELLLAQTDSPVVVLDNFNDYYDPRLKRQNAVAWGGESRVTLVEGDFRDRDLNCELLLSHGVRAICHLGGSPGVPASLREPLTSVENNIAGTVALLEAARRHPVERFLFASSSTVYGRGAAAPFVEDAPLGVPSSPYGASKRSAELLGFTYHQLFGVPFVSLRLFNVIGPRLRPELALAAFTRAILAGQPLALFGDGSVLRDFTHVADICRGFLAALTAPNIAGQCLNLGHDQPIPIRRLIELIEAATGMKAQIEHHAPRAEDMPFTHADLTKSRRLLGYEPRVPVEAAVAEYVDWFRGQL
ncbi:MAG: NAD-dependent epimerase/dehydratase family protein [Pirellulaceae bacterium]|nr:NAD-dependent epimerase/dehydratase family protein [Pirellulaceae bacterium]